MFEEFTNKVIFVTGAGSGMGRAVAVRFGSMGCKVAVAARNPAAAAETVALVQQAGGQAIFTPCDVTQEASVQAAIQQTVDTFGSLDFAFNNAGCGADGVHIPFVPLTEVTAADWSRVLDTNLTGVFHCLKYELRQMQRQGSGAIVNTASIAGLHMTPNFGAYGPSKAGVIAITQTAAVENAKAGIRVNVICPGPTDGTNLMADSVSAGAQDVERLTSQVIPLGKLGTTTDVADAVVFLCSNLSGHITGSVLPVCGGMQM
jgi:NAD(P)-dependent dehydrogenase (short-subunit alcohol dehydrogenase family)